MYRFLLSRQWVGLSLLALALIPTMVELGFWHLHRHEARVARNDLVAAHLAAPVVPVDRLSAPGRTLGDRARFRTVRASGVYDTEHEVVVRQRTDADGESIGYFVVTPLVRPDGTAVLVNRGWIPAGGDLTRFPEVPPPPRGRVTVTGLLMRDETTEDSGIREKPGLPDRQVMLIDSRQRATAMDRPVLSGYVQLTASSPEPAGEPPARLPEPDHSGIGAHMAYAVQWWLFAAAVPVGWTVLVRRERRDRAARAAAGGADGTPATSGDAPTAGGGAPRTAPAGAGTPGNGPGGG